MARRHRALIEEQDALAGVDPVLDRLVDEFGPVRMRGSVHGRERFPVLARAIAYQQLNGNAAATIYGRVIDACGGEVTPETLLAAGPDQLRACGLSGSKTKSMLDLAARVDDGRLRLGRLGHLPDEEVVERLTSVWGIGRWTAQMFLISTLGRLDVWPTGDYGVRAGYGKAWGHADCPDEAEMDALGERFSRGRTLVASYCWQVTDTWV
jgi:DNA-3-methyladenine glycosylase II